MKKLYILFVFILMVSCKPEINVNDQFNDIAEAYVKLVLEVGLYDPYFVDAYYGPEEWKPAQLEDENAKIPSEGLLTKIDNLNRKLMEINVETLDENLKLRHNYIKKQLIAVKGRIEMLSGKSFTFDEETGALYDVITPDYSLEHFQSIINELDKLLPGEGTLTDRYTEFKEQFIIPKEKLDTVFHTAIKEARKRSRA